MSSDLITSLPASMRRPLEAYATHATPKAAPPAGGRKEVEPAAAAAREAGARDALPLEPVADREALIDAVSTLQDYVQNIQRDLEFTVDEELGRVIIRVYDSETKEIIRQIPAEEMLKLARQMAQVDEGLLLNTRA